MKYTLRSVAALLGAAALVALSYPQVGNAVEAVNTVETNTFAGVEMNLSESDDKTKSASTDAKATAKSGKSSSASGTFSATAYALRGRTASGSYVRRGVIAADPRVLPLGTRVQITAGAWSGTYVVTDTGGVIKGRKIDIWVPSNAEARRFGRRKVTLTVLGR